MQPKNFGDFPRSRSAAVCAGCGEDLFAPKWSEHLDESKILHLWSCDSCHCEFETTISNP
jgi:hypothetical protein